MNKNNFWAHIHLAVNDVPVIGFLLATLFLALAFITPQRDGWARAGMLTLAVSILGVLAAFFSGNPALHVIGNQPGTSARALSLHHLRDLVAVILAGTTMIVAAVAVLKARKAGWAYSTGWLKVVLPYCHSFRCGVCVDKFRRRQNKSPGSATPGRSEKRPCTFH